MEFNETSNVHEYPKAVIKELLTWPCSGLYIRRNSKSQAYGMIYLNITNSIHLVTIHGDDWYTYQFNIIRNYRSRDMEKIDKHTNSTAYNLVYKHVIAITFRNPFAIGWYSISQEICTRFLLCCALLWLYIDWFSHIHQAYFTGTVAI